MSVNQTISTFSTKDGDVPHLTEVIHFWYTLSITIKINIMATSKKRVNISIPKSTEDILSKLAKRDQVPQATKAAELLHLAIEFEEDRVLDAIASTRDVKKNKLVGHKKVW